MYFFYCVNKLHLPNYTQKGITLILKLDMLKIILYQCWLLWSETGFYYISQLSLNCRILLHLIDAQITQEHHHKQVASGSYTLCVKC